MKSPTCRAIAGQDAIVWLYWAFSPLRISLFGHPARWHCGEMSRMRSSRRYWRKAGSSISDQTDLARGWLRKACSDLAAARRMLSGDGPYDTACFHSQQATEKTFKALLAYRGQPILRAHDLEELARLCQPARTDPRIALAGTGRSDRLRGADLLRFGDLAFAARGPSGACTR